MLRFLKQIAAHLRQMITAPFAARRQLRQAQQTVAAERRALLAELASCRTELRCTEALFNETADPGMVESCIYQHRALLARHDSLVRQVRQLDESGVSAGLPAAYPQPACSAGQAVRIPL